MIQNIKIEIEAKFIIPNRKTFNRILQSIQQNDPPGGKPAARQVIDTYIDTETRTFFKAGYAFRIRRRGTGLLLALKALGSQADMIHRRPEYEIALPAGSNPLQASSWPSGQFKEMVQSTMGDSPLEHLLTVTQLRTICPLHKAERPVVELSLDEVRFDAGVPCFELELELLPEGTEEELEQIAGSFKTRWDLTPVSTSKFERGLAWKERLAQALRQRQPDMSPFDPMSEAGRKTLRLHFERMLAHEPGTRSGLDIEDLHDMRVATRRMRAAFRVFGPYFDRKSIRQHLKDLQQAGRTLGLVRDLDVFEEKAQQYLASLPAGEAHDLDPLLDAWRRERSVAREKMLSFLDGECYSRFLQRFDRFLSTPGAGALPFPSGKPIPQQVRHVASQLVYTRFDAVRAYDRLLPTTSVELLHGLRIDLKHLRYTLEFFSPVLGPEAYEVIREVKVLQDHLGDLNDAVTAQRIIREYLNKAIGDQPGLEAYLQDREKRMLQLLETFPAAWEHFNRPELNHSLALAIAAL